MKKVISIFIIIMLILNILCPLGIAAQKEENKVIENQEQRQEEEQQNTLEEEENDDIEKEESEEENTIEENETEENETKEDMEIPQENVTKEEKQEETSQDLIQEDEIETINTENEIKAKEVIKSSNIENGVYKIRTGVKNSSVLDIDGGSTANGANLQIWQDSNVNQQKFEIINLGNGYYKIMAIHSGKVLDVANAGKENLTNVWQHEDNGTDAQQWIIKEAEDGYCYIISKCNGLYLDVNGGSSANGTNVQMYEGHGGASQKFKLEKVAEKTVENGTYKIVTGVNNKSVLDIAGGSRENGANLQIWQDSEVNQQKFEITYLNNGYYKITAVHSGKVLDVANAGTTNLTNVWQHEDNGTNAQQWAIKDLGDGYYQFVSKCNGLYLDVNGGSSANGTNVQMYEGHGQASQKFKLVETKKEEMVGEKTVEDGIYKIVTGINNSSVLDIDGGSTANGANLQIWQDSNVTQQRFKITYLNNGYYKITAMHSGKVLDVANAGTTNLTNVWQHEDNGTNAQQWIIKEAGEGYYNIISKCNELYLDVNGGSFANGTNVQMYEGHGGASQRFKLEPIKELIGEKTIEDGVYKIATGINSNMVLDVEGASTKDGTNIQIYEKNNTQQQVFSVTYNGDGTYKIQAVFSEKVLDVAGGLDQPGTNVWQYRENGSDAQKWIIQKTEDGYYHVICQKNGLYLDVEGGSSANGTNVQVYTSNGKPSQKFQFEEYIEQEHPIVYDGTYRITTALASNMALDIDGGSKEAKANVQIWSSTNVLQQKFKLKHLGNNYYEIEIVHSKMVLEVADPEQKIQSNVWQNTANGSDAQQWLLKDAGDGYYYLISKANGLYLDVYAGGTANGTNVQVYEGHGGNSQRFKLDEIYFGIDVSYSQKEIDYEALVNSGQVEFMIARTGWYKDSENKLMIDEQFERNYQLAKENGIPLGTYLYSYAQSTQEAQEEAEALANYLTSTGRSFELPVFIDIEDKKYQEELPKQVKTDICKVFGETLKNAGYRVGIYTFKKWIIEEIDMKQIPEDYSIWVAAWGKNDGYVPEDIYRYTGKHDLWQFTSSGTVAGISGNVDINIAYKKMF